MARDMIGVGKVVDMGLRHTSTGVMSNTTGPLTGNFKSKLRGEDKGIPSDGPSLQDLVKDPDVKKALDDFKKPFSEW